MGHVILDARSGDQDHLRDCAHVTPGTVSVEGCHSGHWKCVPRSRVERDHPGYCGHMTPGAGFIRWGHPGVFGHAIPDAGSVRWDIPGDCVYLFSPDTDSGMWGHPGDCACEMQSAVSGEETDPGKCGHVSQCIWSGRGPPWILWTCDLRCRVWKVGSLLVSLTGYPGASSGLESSWRLWTCDLRCRVWEVLSPRTLWSSDPRYSAWRWAYPGDWDV